MCNRIGSNIYGVELILTMFECQLFGVCRVICFTGGEGRDTIGNQLPQPVCTLRSQLQSWLGLTRNCIKEIMLLRDVVKVNQTEGVTLSHC